jgi:hypothetical protein
MLCSEHYTAEVKEEMTSNSLNKIRMKIEKFWKQQAKLQGWG